MFVDMPECYGHRKPFQPLVSIFSPDQINVVDRQSVNRIAPALFSMTFCGKKKQFAQF